MSHGRQLCGELIGWSETKMTGTDISSCRIGAGRLEGRQLLRRGLLTDEWWGELGGFQAHSSSSGSQEEASASTTASSAAL